MATTAHIISRDGTAFVDAERGGGSGGPGGAEDDSESRSWNWAGEDFRVNVRRKA